MSVLKIALGFKPYLRDATGSQGHSQKSSTIQVMRILSIINISTTDRGQGTGRGSVDSTLEAPGFLVFGSPSGMFFPELFRVIF